MIKVCFSQNTNLTTDVRHDDGWAVPAQTNIPREIISKEGFLIFLIFYLLPHLLFYSELVSVAALMFREFGTKRDLPHMIFADIIICVALAANPS